MKALKNFKCNGVKKKIGELLTSDELVLIGQDFRAKLIEGAFVEVLEKPVIKEPIVEEKPVKKVTKKKKGKK